MKIKIFLGYHKRFFNFVILLLNILFELTKITYRFAKYKGYEITTIDPYEEKEPGHYTEVEWIRENPGKIKKHKIYHTRSLRFYEPDKLSYYKQTFTESKEVCYIYENHLNFVLT